MTWLDHHGLEVLDYDECLRRLGDAYHGRVAFTHGERCLVLPVLHVVHDRRVCFRSSIGTKLGEAAAKGQCSFQVDEFDVDRNTGWSVLAFGRLAIVRDADLLAHLDAFGPMPPLRGAEQGRWVSLQIDELSGRELRPDAREA